MATFEVGEVFYFGFSTWRGHPTGIVFSVDGVGADATYAVHPDDGKRHDYLQILKASDMISQDAWNRGVRPPPLDRARLTKEAITDRLFQIIADMAKADAMDFSAALAPLYRLVAELKAERHDLASGHETGASSDQ